MKTFKKILEYLFLGVIKIQVRTPTEVHGPVHMAGPDRLTLSTDGSKIIVKRMGWNRIEVVLIPPEYVQQNWENCND